jgi:hypothetical protein
MSAAEVLRLYPPLNFKHRFELFRKTDSGYGRAKILDMDMSIFLVTPKDA